MRVAPRRLRFWPGLVDAGRRRFTLLLGENAHQEYRTQEKLMRWAFAVLAGCFVVLPCKGQFPFPNACDPTVGGWAIYRDRSQTICMVGGVFCPRRITVTERTPQGPMSSQAVYPSWLKDPTVVSQPVPLPAPRPPVPRPARTSRLVPKRVVISAA